jgi:tight adherence protein C
MKHGDRPSALAELGPNGRAASRRVNVVISWAAFVVTAIALLVWTRAGQSHDRLGGRLRDLARRDANAPAQPLVRSTLARLAVPLSANGSERTHLRTRLVHAGLYGRQALSTFLIVKGVVMGVPWVVGLALGLGGWVAMVKAAPAAATLSAVGMIGTGVWLDRRKVGRQQILIQGLPDVLDLLVLCVEGGLSIQAAFRRVAVEIRSAHPLLGLELTIVEREVQLGLSLAEAIKRFAQRCDMEEVSALGRLLGQTERLGTGLAKVLRAQSEMMRFRLVQQAEERAQKAGAKMLLPMMLFIFPGIFFVILAPGYFQYDKAKQKQKPAIEKAVKKSSLRPSV